MALFSVRSERQLCERLEYDMLFKWFLDMNILDASFNHSVFSKNKERLLKADVSREFFRKIVDQARDRGFCRMSISVWTGLYSKPGRR